jgi:hypothetical protein
VAFEIRYAEGKLDRLPALVAELIQANVDIVVTQGSEPVQAGRKVTDTIPIVMASVGDAVGAGFVASLARPGGNVTGLTLVAATARAIERTSKKAKLNARPRREFAETFLCCRVRVSTSVGFMPPRLPTQSRMEGPRGG